MSFVFANYQSKDIIDIVEDRRLYSLTEYFSRFSLEARNNVKYVCMDMYVPYISLVNSIGCIINGVDRRNFYQCHFLIKKS